MTVTLTVIVPACNEASTIGLLLDEVVSALVALDPRVKPGRTQKGATSSRQATHEIIIVDDGSTDATCEVARKWIGATQTADSTQTVAKRLLRHSRNQGKGSAIRTALHYATGRFVIIQDADLEYDPGDYGKLLAPLISGDADVVFGSRRLGTRITLRDVLNPFRHGVTVLNWLVRWWYGIAVGDEATCYKVFPRSVLLEMDLRCERFEFCPEVTAKAARMGLRLIEIPISYCPRGIRDGKKIRFVDFREAVRTLRRYRQWAPSAAPAPDCQARPTRRTANVETVVRSRTS